MLTVDRETANNDTPSLTGSYGVVLESCLDVRDFADLRHAGMPIATMATSKGMKRNLLWEATTETTTSGTASETLATAVDGGRRLMSGCSFDWSLSRIGWL